MLLLAKSCISVDRLAEKNDVEGHLLGEMPARAVVEALVIIAVEVTVEVVVAAPLTDVEFHQTEEEVRPEEGRDHLPEEVEVLRDTTEDDIVEAVVDHHLHTVAMPTMDRIIAAI